MSPLRMSADQVQALLERRGEGGCVRGRARKCTRTEPPWRRCRTCGDVAEVSIYGADPEADGHYCSMHAREAHARHTAAEREA